MADITAVNIGDAADDGTGDPLRTAFDKLNDNDEALNTELAGKASKTVSAASKLLGRGDSGSGDVQEITIGSNLTMSGTTLSATGVELPDDTVTNAKLANMASPTVKGRVAGTTGDPEDISPETFKTEFGFGSLADQDNITVADISASGTPSASTFFRGDGAWAGVVPSVTYEVEDIDDATALTASHARYQISGGALQILKLRLRNAADQSQPVTVTMPDSDAVTPAGIEFDFIVADDQTGTCTIQRETNGTINGATSVDFAGARATAVLIIDANPGSAPVTRLEGETDEARTVQGATTFADQAVFTSGVDINGASTLSHTLTLDASGAIVGGDKVASALELKDISETAFDAGNKGGAVSFDYRDGAWQFCTVTSNISSVTVTNWPASGKSGTLKLEFVQDGTGGKTIAWGAAFRFPGGTDFTLSTAANAIDEFVLATRTGGTTVRVYEGGKAFAA